MYVSRKGGVGQRAGLHVVRASTSCVLRTRTHGNKRLGDSSPVHIHVPAPFPATTMCVSRANKGEFLKVLRYKHHVVCDYGYYSLHSFQRIRTHDSKGNSSYDPTLSDEEASIFMVGIPIQAGNLSHPDRDEERFKA